MQDRSATRRSDTVIEFFDPRPYIQSPPQPYLFSCLTLISVNGRSVQLVALVFRDFLSLVPLKDNQHGLVRQNMQDSHAHEHIRQPNAIYQ
jgi:hypothetical protein